MEIEVTLEKLNRIVEQIKTLNTSEDVFINLNPNFLNVDEYTTYVKVKNEEQFEKSQLFVHQLEVIETTIKLISQLNRKNVESGIHGLLTIIHINEASIRHFERLNDKYFQIISETKFNSMKITNDLTPMYHSPTSKDVITNTINTLKKEIVSCKDNIAEINHTTRFMIELSDGIAEELGLI